MNLYSFLLSQARSRPERTFLYEASTEGMKAFGYGEILEKVNAAARSLAGLRLARGSRIAILSENNHEWVVAYFAAVSLGLTVVPLDPQATLKLWFPILKHSETKVLFVSSKFKTQFDGFPGDLRRVTFGDEFDAFVRNGRQAAAVEFPIVEETDLATLAYTSGTTGVPKGVSLNHANLLNSAREMHTGHPDEGGVCATILPFNHIYGFAVLTSRILKGDSLAIFRTVNEQLLADVFKRLRPYVLAGVPLLFERYGRALKEKLRQRLPGAAFRWVERAAEGSWGEDAERLLAVKRRLFSPVHEFFGGRMSHFASGGAPMEPALVRFFHTVGIAVCQGYGLTETAPLVAMGRRKSLRPGSVGRPVGGMSIRIENPDRQGVGEILVRGCGVMQGYFLDAEATAKAIDSEGWFRTGDLGRLDADGYLYIAGRLKEMIVTSNGKKIYPADLFALYEKIHGVREACLFGIPDRSGHGETVHLQIFPDPDLGAVKGRDAVIAEIKEGIARVSGELPEYQRPRSVAFSEEPFPRSATLKIKKYEVKRLWQESQRAEAPQKTVQDIAEGANDPLLHSEAALVVRRILKSLLPHPAPVTTASSLDLDLGMDSLTQIEFWATLERTLHVKIPEEAVARLKVVGHIVEYLLDQADLGAKAHEAMEEIDVESRQRTVGSWADILETDAESSRAKALAVVGSHRRTRPLFLKVFRKLFDTACGLQVEGLENLPKDGGYILAPNHECYIDNIFVASLLPEDIQKNMAVVGAKEFFDRAVTRLIAKLCHTIPVDRNQVSSSVLQIAAQALKMGKVLLIHPEGTRSPDGELLSYKTGAAILADYAQCPIIPVHIEGAHEFWPKGAKWPQKRRTISVTFGAPILPVPSHGDQTRVVQKDAQILTNRLMQQALAMRERKEGMASLASRSERCPVGSGEG